MFDAGVILGQPEKFRLHAGVGLENLAVALENQRLRRMKASEISGTACCLIKPHPEHRFGVLQKLARLGEKAGRLRGHRSKPSRRISYISGVSSR